MFNVDPPANVYTEEPSLDITFGVENPGYELRSVTVTAETETSITSRAIVQASSAGPETSAVVPPARSAGSA